MSNPQEEVEPAPFRATWVDPGQYRTGGLRPAAHSEVELLLSPVRKIQFNPGFVSGHCLGDAVRWRIPSAFRRKKSRSFRLKEQRTERRQRQFEGKRPSMLLRGLRHGYAGVAHSAAGVLGAVAVQHFPPPSPYRNADPIFLSRHGSEVARYQYHVAG